MQKVYYKDIDLSKRDYKIIDNKIKYNPLNIYITKKDALEMLDDKYNFYKDIINEYKKNYLYLIFRDDYNKYKEKVELIKTTIRAVKTGQYDGFKIDVSLENKWKKYFLCLFSIDGYIPHIDTLEIV